MVSNYYLQFLILLLSITASHQKAGHNFKPRFDPNNVPLMLEVNENTNIGFKVADISRYAIDDEGDQLEYELDEKGNEICHIHRNDGTLKLKIKPDRESKSSYDFKVRVSDNFHGGINRGTELQVYLYILDENDNKPEFVSTPYHANIREDSPNGTTVTTVIATDEDAGRNKEVRYLFKSGTDHKSFKLNPNSGLLTLSGTLDYEHESVYNLYIVAKDEGSPALTSETLLQVKVDDVDDNVPYFVLHQSEKTLSERTPVGTEIAVIKAIDGDKSINNKVFYEIIEGDDEGLFEIHQETGSVIIKKSLDRESFFGFDLRIKAYEVVNPSSFATILLKISLIDENDNRPYFEQRFYLVRIMEDSLFANTIISTNIRAVDDDVTYPNNHLRYSIEENEYFDILKESGTLIIKKRIENLRNKRSYKFKIFATEVSTRQHYSTSTNITVFIESNEHIAKTVLQNEQKSSSNILTALSFKFLLLWTLFISCIYKLV